MLDIKFVRENPDLVKENIKKKFQDHKLHLVDEVLEEDKEMRASQQKGDELRAERKKISKEIGLLMKQGKKEEAEKVKEKVAQIAKELVDLEEKENQLRESVRDKMLQIPNIIDPSVPIGKDDSENVEVQRFGEPIVPDYEIPYHADIIKSVNGMDKEAAGRTSGEGFYFLLGDIARLHEAMISCARDFMIDHGFTYAIPPFMIHSDVVTGVISEITLPLAISCCKEAKLIVSLLLLLTLTSSAITSLAYILFRILAVPCTIKSLKIAIVIFILSYRDITHMF